MHVFKEIEKFKSWAITANKSFGEWETEYPDWDRIYSAIRQIIRENPIAEWSEQIINDVLYILARDNECEIIINILKDEPNQLIFLANKALIYSDYNARWQIAFGLGELEINNDEVKSLLNRFSYDENEYVRRRAVFALNKKGV